MSIHGYVGNIITANPTAPTSTVASGVWTTEQQLAAKSAGNWPFTIPTQQIGSSLRFNSADTAYLSRTFSTGNRRTWTWSGWVKRGTLGTEQFVFGNYNATLGGAAGIRFEPDNTIIFYNFVGAFQVQRATTQVFRDPSAWYHIVAILDTTQATASDRAKLYVNGTQITAFSATTNPTQNYDGVINYNDQHEISGIVVSGLSSAFDGYLTEVNFIDGQALTPSSFGRTSTTTGVWEPLAYTGTYGTNGFYVNFSDNSGTTSTTLGKDYSGNGNNWTPNNFSVTAGAGNDSLVDSPTAYGTDTGVGGTVRGNYCTLNALDRNSSGTLVNGNLDWSSGTTAHYGIRGTFQLPADKIYFEATVVSNCTASVAVSFGLATASNPLNAGGSSNTGAYQIYSTSSSTMQSAGSGGTTSSALTAGQVLQCAYDGTTNSAWIGINNTYYNFNFGTSSVSPSAGTNPTFSSLPTGLFPFAAAYSNGLQFNFGQRAFAYTAPSGFKALCTTNLPTPTIGATSTTLAGKYFNAITYTGDGTASRSITGVGFRPDFVWIKNRTVANFHQLHDAVRGATVGMLASNSTNAEDSAYPLTSFNTDGYTTKSGAQDGTNNSGSAIVAWNWNAGGSTVTNTSGTISAQVRASTISGVSIVNYTGNGTAGATVGHGLGTTPSMIIVKSRSIGTSDWVVWHTALTSSNNNYLILNQTAAVNTANQPWNNTLPTSSVFSLRTWDGVNQSSATYVAYLFSAVAGYSAFGSYTGNGSTDGPFVYTGFRPRYILFKRSDGVSAWEVVDTSRSAYNVVANVLFPNTNGAESSSGDFANLCDILSNGFKLRSTSSASNTGTVIYAAFAEAPFKYALAR
jgi:hypothetical protein